MTFIFVLLGGIALIVGIVTVLDGIGYRRQQQRKAGKS